jgi:putative intracellular protease/amidase
MKNLFRVLALVLLGFAAISTTSSLVASPEAAARHYVCPPCGLPCDEAAYDQPGTCPKCGMALVEQEEAHADASHARKKAAILIFTGVQIIDYTGPYEVFGAADYDVYTVAETKEPITTSMGMTVVPKYTFADAPQPDVLVVPGGGVRAARDSRATLKWVADVTARAEHTLSVCNGAFILGSAGLLDGLTATTTATLIESLKSEFPKTKVVEDRRYVDNGKIITAGGLSSGIDGALHVVARMFGEGRAQQVALGEEYDWHPRGGFARGALADRMIPSLDLSGAGKWEIASTEGGTDRWELVIKGTSDLEGAALMDRIRQALATKAKWTRLDAAGAGSATALSSRWRFQGRDGQPWNGAVALEPNAAAAHQYTARVTIARAS